MNLTVVLPFHSGDLDKARNLIDWIVELGGCKRHNLLLAADSKVDVEVVRDLKKIAKDTFFDVNAITIDVPDNMSGWPRGCSTMFLKVSEYIYKTYKQPFFWMEADAIPLSKKWLDEIADEYSQSPAKFMGSVMVGKHGDSEVAHMNGVGVYPQDSWLFYEPRKAMADSDVPFDAWDVKKVLAMCRNTTKIHNVWGTKELPPVLVKEASGKPGEFLVSDIRRTAFVFHRDKEQNLIPILRGLMSGGKK